MPSLHFTPSLMANSVVQKVFPSTSSSFKGEGKSAAKDGIQSNLWEEYVNSTGLLPDKTYPFQTVPSGPRYAQWLVVVKSSAIPKR